jgi:dienelactone hydrolase
MHSSELNYQHGGVSLSGLLVRDDQVDGTRPGIVVFPDARGIGDHAIDVARRLAMHGLVVLVADLYGNGTRARDMAQAMELMTHLRSDVTRWRGRAQAGLDALSREENVDRGRLAVIGYCFGGSTALELARGGADVAGIVSFHGGLSSPRPEDAKNIRGKVLVCHGALDPLVPPAQVAAFEAQMSTTDVDWQVCVYGGALHAFTNPGVNVEGMAYHAAADRRSWKAMLALFDEIF